MKIFIFLMRLRGQDPKRAGRNKDIDFTRLGVPPERIHAEIDYRHFWDVKVAASAQHASQGGGGLRTRMLPVWLQKRLFAKDTYIRAYPPPPAGRRESDLFP